MFLLLTEVLSMESIDKELMLNTRATVRLFLMSLLLLVASLGEPCGCKTGISEIKSHAFCKGYCRTSVSANDVTP